MFDELIQIYSRYKIANQQLENHIYWPNEYDATIDKEILRNIINDLFPNIQLLTIKEDNNN